MKRVLLGLFQYHLIPIILSLVLLFSLNQVVSVFLSRDSKPETKIVTGTASAARGMFANCSEEQAEIELIGSLQDKHKLTVFGSSELQSLPYSCFFFLPDSCGIKTTAFGHAYHQNLSIACELMAAEEHLDGANICIILSPGWFLSEGTNIEAFLEFVRPNFLRSIIHNRSIPEGNKLHIAHYVRQHFKDINNPSKELRYFRNLSYTGNDSWFLSSSMTYSKSLIRDVKYQVKSQSKCSQRSINTFDWDAARKRLQEDFFKTCTNNQVFVDSAYYKEYLVKDGKPVEAAIEKVSPGNELEDFKLVLEILARHRCKATFILQPLNPYVYTHLDHFNAVRTQIKKELSEYQFPLLDLFKTTAEDYTPGILKDVMHPSDRGWIEMNEFLVKQYQRIK